MTTVTVTLGSSVNPSVYGETITFSVGVVSDDIPNFPGPPTGTVELFDGLTSLGTQPLDGTGNCSFLISSLDVLNSPHDVFAQYNGDGTFTGNSSNHVSQVVNQDTTTTALVSSLNPSSFGDMVTFTATLTADAPGSGTPTGTVTFFDGVAPLTTRSLVAGVASLAISSLTVAASPHDINATYNGDDNFSTSDSNHISQVITLAATTLSIGIVSGASPPSLNPSTPVVDPGANCEFVVTVTGGPAASGTITLDLDGVAFGGSNPVLSGTADFFAVIPAHALTPAIITAHYSGDAGHAASTVPLTVDIGHRTYVTFGFTNTSESSGLTQNYTVAVGTVVTVSAQVRRTSIIAPFNIVHSGPAVGATGILLFKEGLTILGIGTIDPATAIASIDLNLPVGTHIIDAFFSEDTPHFLWAGDSQHWTSGAQVTYLSGMVVVTPGSGGEGPRPHPPGPPTPGPTPSPNPLPSAAELFRACDQRIACIGTDSPVLNLSSEAIDFPNFFSLYYGGFDPPMGSSWSATSCVGVATSLVSQEEADLEAAVLALSCAANSGSITFWNTQQTCVFVCEDGVTQNTATTPAHSFQATTQALADGLANSYACLQATLKTNCFAEFGNAEQTCVFTCPDGGPDTSFTTPANTFRASSQAAADSLAHQYACASAQIQSGCQFVSVGGVGNTAQTCSSTCSNGSATFTVPANTIFAPTQIEADNLAHQYACLSAQILANCPAGIGNTDQTCSFTCPGTLVVTNYTVLANTFQDDSLSNANALAHEFACLSAQLVSGCTTGVGNTAQNCNYNCPSGPISSYTTPANSFYAQTQAEANALANSYACLKARSQTNCIPSFGNTVQTCTYNCQSGQEYSFAVAANTFHANTQAAADSLANSYACLSAALLAFQDPNCGSQPANCTHPPCSNISIFLNRSTTCSTLCPDGTTFVFGVGAGRFAALNQLLADQMAYTYACRQAQLNAVCLSSMSVSSCCFGATGIVSTISASGVSSRPINFWEIVAGAVPPGMTFQGGFRGSSIVISGTPSVAGNFSFTVRVTAPNGNFMQKIYSFCVIELMPTSLPGALINVAYSQTITPSCGGVASAWFVTNGSLPPGITLDAENGTLIGTPTSVGSFTFTIAAQMP